MQIERAQYVWSSSGLNYVCLWFLICIIYVNLLQLLCLARAVLNKSKVVIVDEVMSVINANIEGILQRVLKTAFADRTVINLSVIDFKTRKPTNWWGCAKHYVSHHRAISNQSNNMVSICCGLEAASDGISSQSIKNIASQF